MAAPDVPIDVDPATGIWRTDGLPMIYLPRHFLVNNHLAAEEALGLETYRDILRAATEKSALHWCRTEAKTHGLAPEATFHHYFKRLSQRGWGQFMVQEIDLRNQRGTININHSVFVLETREAATHPVCYMFEGFMTGAFRFLLESTAAPGQVKCWESRCAAQGHECCQFNVAGN